jgi:hypothetical protein
MRYVLHFVRFHVLTAARMKMTAFSYIAPCSLVKQTDVSEVRTASIIRATRIPEGCHFRPLHVFVFWFELALTGPCNK